MIRLESLRIELSGFTVHDIDLSIDDGEFFMLIGPTGAGKTLVLEAIAGILSITDGRILVKGRDITSLPPEARGIGIVYQDYALFPHLCVLDNITYGLRYHRKDNIASEKWMKWLLDQLGLMPLAERSVKNLSGGERQRVAIARALAVNPSVLLLDEPLSALDPNFREEIREVLKHLHREVGITFLMVTHDFAEALFLGERMAVINQGKLEQTGPVVDVFQRPATPFVAEFVGMKNIFPAVFNEGTAHIEEIALKVEAAPSKGHGHIAIRPEDIVIKKEAVSNDGLNLLEAEVLNITQRGPYYEVSAKAGKIVFQTMLSKSDLIEMTVKEAREVYLAIRTSDIHVF